jgi:hypothetical protein
MSPIYDIIRNSHINLSKKIHLSKGIKGVKVSNIKDEVKQIQHADDCIHFIQDKNSYEKLIEEFEKFGKVSESKI